MVILLIRLITAVCLFSFLGKANIWFNSISNIILAIGYRCFLVLSPYLEQKTGKYAVSTSLLISIIGTLLLCSNSNIIMVVGATLASIGFSISGYLIKYESAETPKGAAHNKIALNVGSLLSGIIILIFFGGKTLFFLLAAFLLTLSFFVSLTTLHTQKKVNIPLSSSFKIKKFFGWLLIGICIGIKLFGVFSVLPQTLINSLGKLPNWYGIMIFVNSAIIIIFQLPIITLIEKLNKRNLSFVITIIIMLIGMLIIAFPQLFLVHFFFGALFWTSLLSLVECCASYLDVHGVRAGYLLIKEISVGLGGGLTVLVSRYMNPHISSNVIAAIGIISLLGAYIFLYDDLKPSKNELVL